MVRRRAAMLLGWAGVALACGPSYQALYEGDARFEHCYALEESGAVTMTQKGDCWHDWTQRYTYGQTRDRVEYAYSRSRALSRAPQAPTDEAMMEAAPGAGRESSISAPAPTNAFAPPPKILAETSAASSDQNNLPGYTDAGPAARVTESAPEQARPGSVCGAGCDLSFDACRERAKCDGGAACDGCGRDYRKCMRGCYAK